MIVSSTHSRPASQFFSCSKNGKYLGDAYTIPEQLRGQALFPAVTLKNAELHFNFGATPFKHPPTVRQYKFPFHAAQTTWLGRQAAHTTAPTAPTQDGYVGMDKQSADNLASPVEAAPKVEGKSGRPFAIILEPSRELAEQTRDQIRLFKKHLSSPKIRDTLLIGGVNAKDQLKDLSSGVEIVVGTPGRVEGFVEQGKLDLSNVGAERGGCNAPYNNPSRLFHQHFCRCRALGSLLHSRRG